MHAIDLHTESQHFKHRILDFFDVFARRQPSNPLLLLTILPLLRVVLNASPTEADLSNKAASILRTRLGKSKLVPSPVLTTIGIVEQIHVMARKAPNADFSAICSVCSLYIFRVISSPSGSTAEQHQKQALEMYTDTLTDYLERKASTLHPPFIVDFIRRFPTSAFPLAKSILEHLEPTGKVKVYRQVQAYGILQVFSQHLGVIAKTIPSSEIVSFLQSFTSTTYSLLSTVAIGSPDSEGSSDGHGWNAQRLRDIIKVVLHLARSSKSVVDLKTYEAAWKIEELKGSLEALKQGEKTGSMKGVLGMVEQMISITRAVRGKPAGATVNEMGKGKVTAAADQKEASASSRGQRLEGKVKKRKSDGQEKDVKKKKRKGVEDRKE